MKERNRKRGAQKSLLENKECKISTFRHFVKLFVLVTWHTRKDLLPLAAACIATHGEALGIISINSFEFHSISTHILLLDAIICNNYCIISYVLNIILGILNIFETRITLIINGLI